MTTLTLGPVDQAGAPIVAGPYVNAGGPCRWCGQHVRVNDQGTSISDSTGRGWCTPAERGARCRLVQEASLGIDPLRLLSHDGRCSCQRSFPHLALSGPAYPFPDRVPWHCGQPMLLATTGWSCRGRTENPRRRKRDRPTFTACGQTWPLGS